MNVTMQKKLKQPKMLGLHAIQSLWLEHKQKILNGEIELSFHRYRSYN